jgi:4-alpha-glucanotransferase
MADRPSRFHSGRHAGVLVPLFSIPSRGSWGIGEIADIPRFARWLDQAGLDFVQLLPVNEMQEGQSSPYSALSAMAIDPIFISLAEVEDFVDAGGEAALSAVDRATLARARTATFVDYDAVRAVKTRALRGAFDRFMKARWATDSAGADGLRRFAERQRWWLEEYALFRALHEEQHGRYWLEWEPGLRNREPAALAAARARLAAAILYFQYLQWIADEQWQRARRACGSIGIFGDFPFMVSGHSADVWARQDEFRLDASVGVPPDAFSETGQDWGLPLYRWDVIAERGYDWLVQRVRRSAALFDAFRIDHLVGFYRTFYREEDGTAHFSPVRERAQRQQGEALMALFAAGGSAIIAEDLGSVPDFVRQSLAELGIPGLKVLRWEREWDLPEQPFRDPVDYPACSVAISGTHDTETLAEWWDSADAIECATVAAIHSIRKFGCPPDQPYSPAVRDALLKTLFHSGSNLVILPLQDIFGWRDRINTPAVVDNQNWTWRLPWPVDALLTETDAIERARFLRSLARGRRSLSEARS